MILKENNPALAKAITIHQRAKRSPLDTNILKSVSANSKMGKGDNLIVKGKWAGMPMFQMSLEERATCPSDCLQWRSCFANNMAFAHRIDHTHPDFLSRLSGEIDALCSRYRFGVVIRPHVVGDFFSAEYAQFWVDKADQHKNLYLFGFTHRKRDTDIGQVLLKGNHNPQVWIRFSDQGGPMSANVEGEGFQCPEQTKKTQSCLTCGACWTTTKAVSFRHH